MESSPDLLPASPAVPVAPYLGGKRFLAARLIERIAAIPHRSYIEPFVGMGGVFLRRPFRAHSEVINDISGDVATLFRVLQRHYVPFLEMLRWQLTCRATFERLTATDPTTLTDLERAARFLYLQRTAFGGKSVGRAFGVTQGLPGRFDVTKLPAILEAVHERLAGVTIERLLYAQLIARYDRPHALFYLDPPYWGGESDYGDGIFDREDFGRLAELLGNLQGRFVLSVNDRPEIRALFARHTIEPVDVAYTVSRESDARGRRKELIITG